MPQEVLGGVGGTEAEQGQQGAADRGPREALPDAAFPEDPRWAAVGAGGPQGRANGRGTGGQPQARRGGAGAGGSRCYQPSLSLTLSLILPSLGQQEFLLPPVSLDMSLNRHLRAAGWAFGTSGKSALSSGRCRALSATSCPATEILNALSPPAPGSEPGCQRTSPRPQSGSSSAEAFQLPRLLPQAACLCSEQVRRCSRLFAPFPGPFPSSGCAPDAHRLRVPGANSGTKRDGSAASDFGVGDKGGFCAGMTHAPGLGLDRKPRSTMGCRDEARGPGRGRQQAGT